MKPNLDLGDDRGSAAVELTLLTPLLLVLLLFVVALGRFGQARADIDGAARDAARAASLRRSAPAATAAAQETAQQALSERRITCAELNVDVDTAAFAPGGSVRVEVTCNVLLSDLSLLRLPGSKQMRGHYTAVIDTFRGAP